MSDVQTSLERLAFEPGDAEALNVVENAYAAEGRWEELLRVYEDNALRADRALAAPLLRKAATVCLNELLSHPRAEAYLRRALQIQPADTETLRSLRELALDHGDYEDGTEWYEKELARTADTAQKVAGLVELAEIYRNYLGRQEKALGALRQAQRTDASCPGIYRVLASIYEGQGRLEQAHGSLQKELEAGGPTDDVLGRISNLSARLLEHPKLHQYSLAAAESTLAHRPDDVTASQVRAELEAFRAQWPDRVKALEQRAAFVEADAEAADIWLSVAEIQLVYGEQHEGALISIDRALAAQPGHPTALRLLEEIYGSGDRYAELADKLEMMAAYTRDPAVAVDLYLKAAMHHAVRLDAPDTASGIYHRVLELDPGNKVASNILAEYYRERQEWEKALQVLAAWAERATQATDKVAAHYACCRILDEELGDKARARPHYETVLQLDPQNQAAARALEVVYREAADHAALSKALAAKLAGAQGDERLAILAELVDLYGGPLDAPAQALEALGEIYQLKPDASMTERLEELAARAGEFGALVSILEGGLDKIDSDADRVMALHSLAALYEGARDAPLEALRIHRRILAIDSSDTRSQESLERLLSIAAESGDKIAIFRELASAAESDGEKVTVLKKLAAELLTVKDYVRAIDVLRDVLRIVPNDAETIDSLLALYRRDNRWEEVCEILTRKVETLEEPAERHPIQRELAALLEQQLHRYDEAVDHYCALLDEAPEDADAVTGLERLLNHSRKVLPIAERLQPRYVAANRWEHTAAMIEIRVREAHDPSVRGQLLRELATLYGEKLLQPAESLGALLRAFQADPADLELRDNLEKIAGVLGDFTGVVRAYRAAAATLEGPSQGEILLRVGHLAEQHGDKGGATLDYLRVLGHDEQTDAVAFTGLQRLVQSGLDPAKLAESAAQVASGLEEPRRAATLRLLARFYEQQLGRPQEAIQTWRAVLEGDGEDAEANAELDRLYLSSVSAEELVPHLREKLSRTTDDAQRVVLAMQLAEVLHDRMQDTNGAIAELTRASEIAPGNRAIWQRLTPLFQQTGQLQDAAMAMYREISLLGEGEERSERLVAYAELVGKEMGDIATALTALQGVMTQTPTHQTAIALLEELHSAAADAALRQRVVAMLATGYQASERWQELVTLQSGHVDDLDEVEARVEALRGIAAIKTDKLDDATGAFGDLERAFREMPRDAELRASLEQLAAASGQWERLAEAYNAALGIVQDEDTQRALRRKLAEVLETRLGRGAEAVEHYRATSDGDLPEDLDALEAMERLLREQGRGAELAEVIGAILGRLPADEETERRKTLLLELGKLCEDHLSDKQRAAHSYLALVALDAKLFEPLRRLEVLLAELGRLDELAEILEKLIELGPQNPDLVDDILKRADTMRSLGNVDEAFRGYRTALLKKREHPAALAGLESIIDQVENKLEIAQMLEPIYTAKQDHAQLAWVLLKRLDATEETGQRKALLRRIGDIYENRLQQKDEAFRMARRSLAEDPADMGVRMWIEKLAGETGALRELAETYVEEAERAEPPLNVQFHRRAAAIFHEKLEDAGAAVAEYEALLEIEERDEKALSGLESIYRTTENHAELVGILRRRLQFTAGLERRREYLTEIASIEAQQLGDLTAAVSTHREVLELTPDDADAFGQIEHLLGEMGDWEQLAAHYQGEVERLAPKRGRDVQLRRLDMLCRRGCLLDAQFGNREDATALFAQILEEEPTHTATVAYLEQRASQGAMEFIDQLEQVYSSQKAWDKYLHLLASKLQLTAENDRRRTIYLQIADVYETELGASDTAMQALMQAYNENRTDLDLLERLEQQAEKANAWEALVAVIGAELDAMPDAKLRQHLLHRLGDICGNRLGQTQQAIGFLQRALQYEPSDTAALEALDSVLEQNEMWAALADVLERRVEIATEPSNKSQLLERLACVWGDRLMDAEAALRCHKQILDIDSDHPFTLKSMEKLYAEVQDWDALASNLARQAEVLTDHEDQIRVHAHAGELYAEELGDNNAAIEHWLKVVELDSTHELANQALDVLLTAEERWEEVAEHYRRQLQNCRDPDIKVDINRRLGVILGDKLGRSEDALESWLQVVNQDPRNLDGWRALMGLYAERAMWEDYVYAARRIIPQTDPAEAKQVRFLLAKALGENLDKREEAIRLAREVRATEPHSVEDLDRLGEMLCNIEAYDDAVVSITKAAELDEDVEAKVQRYWNVTSLYRNQLEKPEEAREALEAILSVKADDLQAFNGLAQIYRDTSEWRRLVSLNEGFVPHANDELRLKILVEIRDTQNDKLGEKELAFIAGCRVYKENPSDLEAADVLEQIALQTEGAEELAAVLEDEVDTIIDSDVKIASYRRIARIYTEQLQDTTAAEETLEKVLAIEPADGEALDALAALGAREERYDKQIAALERKYQQVSEDTQRKSILFEVARIWEDRIGEVDEAVSALRRVLEIDGGDHVALDALARIYDDEARWSELAHVLRRKVEITDTPGENVALRMRVAGLCEGDLNDSEAAIQWYRGVLDFEPGHQGALSSLERVYTGLERWSELIQVFETQLSLTEEAEEKLHLLAKMAAICESEFNSPRDAATVFERAFAVDATHLPTLKNLERLLRTMGEWERLIEILQHHITLITQQDEVTALYLEIGEIYYKELSRVDKAEQIFNAARELNPNSSEAVHHLGRLYERSGNWFQSLEMLQREAEALADDPTALSILLRIGRINEDMLCDQDAAKAAYERALVIDPSYGPALDALKGIARASEDWERYSEHLITQAETAEDAEEKTDLFVEAAKFFLEVREDEPNAIRFYQRALDVTAGHYESSRSLADIFFRNEMWEEAGELYEQVIEHLDKSADAKDFCQKHYRLGYISEKTEQREKALYYYRQAFEADATYLPALEGLGQALLANSEWDEAQKVFQTILIHHRDSLTESEIVDIQWQLGEICIHQGQPDRAYKQFEKALEIDPDHASSLRTLATLEQQMGAWEMAVGRLSRLADVAPGPERIPALIEMSEIARHQLQDLNRCIEALERARKLGQPPADLLERLADAYLTSNHPAKAVEALEDAVKTEQDPQRLSELCFRLATVYETEIKHEPLAVQRYNDALDALPTNIKAFEAIERLLGSRQEWALLEANYRAMLNRAKDLSVQARIVLWRNLAELYRRVLGNIDSAIMAYEVIRKLDPGRAEDTETLAELYGQKPEHRAKAMDMEHERLANSENPVSPIRTLRKLYHMSQSFDAVYSMCAALVFLNEADEEENKIHQYLLRGVPPRASRGLMEEHWKLVLLPDVSNAVGRLAATLYRTAPDFVTMPAKEAGLKKKDHIDVRSSDLYFANMVRYVAKVLGLPPVDIYRKSNSVDSLYLAPCQPPALVAGENSEIFRDPAQRVLLFHIGRNLAYSRPELILARTYPGEELRDLLFGLCLVYNRSLEHTGDRREVDRWARAFERLPQQALKRLQGPSKDGYKEMVKGQPLLDYTMAVERTAARVGFMASSDLAASVRALQEGGDGAASLPIRDRVRELVLFSVSRPYLELRKLIGAALQEAKRSG